MRALSAVELLHIWEQGTGQSRAQQALLLLLAACPEVAPDDLARLTTGERDGRLMMLREWLFGSRLVSIAVCPQCREQLELDFDLADIRAELPDRLSAIAPLNIANYRVEARLPDSLDLFSLTDQKDTASRRRALLERCVVAATCDSQETTVAQMPNDVLDAVAAHITEHDPLADIQLPLNCPSCTHQWHALFDIVSFLWTEINTWALRVVQEVHLLATAYGWREADILAMSARRRQLYLEMVDG